MQLSNTFELIMHSVSKTISSICSFSRHDHSQQSEVDKTAEEISRERAGVEPGNGHKFSHDLDPVCI